MLRALIVLDALTYTTGQLDHVTKTPFARFVSDVYCIAHAGHGTCTEHNDWLDLLDKRASELKAAGIMDLEKAREQTPEGVQRARADFQKTIAGHMEDGRD
jgi:hypothetical protein